MVSNAIGVECFDFGKQTPNSQNIEFPNVVIEEISSFEYRGAINCRSFTGATPIQCFSADFVVEGLSKLTESGLSCRHNILNDQLLILRYV